MYYIRRGESKEKCNISSRCKGSSFFHSRLMAVTRKWDLNGNLWHRLESLMKKNFFRLIFGSNKGGPAETSLFQVFNNQQCTWSYDCALEANMLWKWCQSQNLAYLCLKWTLDATKSWKFSLLFSWCHTTKFLPATSACSLFSNLASAVSKGNY